MYVMYAYSHKELELPLSIMSTFQHILYFIHTFIYITYIILFYIKYYANAHLSLCKYVLVCVCVSVKIFPSF